VSYSIEKSKNAPRPVFCNFFESARNYIGEGEMGRRKSKNASTEDPPFGSSSIKGVGVLKGLKRRKINSNFYYERRTHEQT
jgi:hypothetical protein